MLKPKGLEFKLSKYTPTGALLFDSIKLVKTSKNAAACNPRQSLYFDGVPNCGHRRSPPSRIPYYWWALVAAVVSAIVGIIVGCLAQNVLLRLRLRSNDKVTPDSESKRLLGATPN
jgi:hypothetical protein